MKKTFSIPAILAIALNLHSCGETVSQPGISHLQADTCNNPDANINCCFINIPTALTNTMVIAQPDELGEKLIISGTIFTADGKTPLANAILYAYHTDNNGYYSKNGKESGVQKWHGRLHGWCKTDKNGFYEIQTIRPARYPNNKIPAHIHAAIKTDKNQLFWITDFVFKDDSLVDNKYLSSLRDIGGTGVVDIKKNSENTWTGKRDILLRRD